MAPFHDPSDKNYGGPHGAGSAAADIDGGRMDGFVGQAEERLQMQRHRTAAAARAPEDGASAQCVDVMGYHDAREIPNYWTYAQNFVLQDNMFESDASWSLPEHLFMVSGVVGGVPEWTIRCRASAIEGPLDPEPSEG